ncbi:MAG: threonylcarbamoyl-AMP synthase [Prevotellaceae bacterium]|jgi:L-threonylcarbamoyladenylate synthase|nr:threonylcarbamoyl-AMP synthase [Prevotellaceae bacterium]
MKIEINRTVKALKNGKIILYPTDTVWGIGCDATNAEAVEKIYKLKHRCNNKSMIILVDTVERIARHVKRIPKIAHDFIELSEMPVTIIYPRAKNLAENLIAEDGTIAVRIVNHEFCRKLISVFDCPIVSTSANITGINPPMSFDEISPDVINNVDFIVNREYEETPTKKPSAIIRLGFKNEIEVLRK